MLFLFLFFSFFFFNDPATTEIYTLSLHDALPISFRRSVAGCSTLPRHGDFRSDVQKDRKSTRLNSSHPSISYAVFCLKKKKKKIILQFTTTQIQISFQILFTNDYSVTLLDNSHIR